MSWWPRCVNRTGTWGVLASEKKEPPMKKITILMAATVTVLLAACGSSSPSQTGRISAPTATASPFTASSSPAALHHHRHHHHRHHRALAAAPGARCDAALWAHVYHPDRLHVVRQCMTVRGTVTEVRWEPDGDLHIRLATRAALVNSANDQGQGGDLLLEEICQGPVSQADAEAACQGVPHDLTIPAPGDRVTVTGSYVLDADHGWMEIHPVTRLTITGQGAAAPAPPPPSSAQPAGGGSCHPTTPSGNCYEPGEFCSAAEHGETGVAGDGKTITCAQDGSYWRWS
jgi:hypothetical protein